MSFSYNQSIFGARFVAKSFMLPLKSSFGASWRLMETIARPFNLSGNAVRLWLRVRSPPATDGKMCSRRLSGVTDPTVFFFLLQREKLKLF